MAVTVSLKGPWRVVYGTTAEVGQYLGDKDIPIQSIKGVTHDGSNLIVIINL